VLRNLTLQIKADGFDSALLEFQCNLSSRDLEALRGSMFAPTGNPAGAELYWQCRQERALFHQQLNSSAAAPRKFLTSANSCLFSKCARNQAAKRKQAKLI